MVTLVNFFTAVGVLISSFCVYRVVLFLWFYFGRPSDINNYRHGEKPYALITGATDGIGKAIAQELYGYGFNLILHGRNEEKMRKVIADLRKTGSESQDVLYFLADVTKAEIDFASLIAPFKDLHITLIVHNAGGTPLKRERLDGWEEEEILSTIRFNVTFPLFLTRPLLPILRKVAKSGPVLVTFIGSLASVTSPPRLAIYAGSKAFLAPLARALDNDERVWDNPTGVRFQHLLVGPVISNSYHGTEGLTAPNAETFARAAVASMGCGQRTVIPWAFHALLQSLSQLIGEESIDRETAKSIDALFKEYEKRA